MRLAAALLGGLALVAQPLGAQRALTPMQASVGAVFEDNVRVGGYDLVRLPLTWGLAEGQPRVTLLEFEPAFGWHVSNGAGDASGLSYSRFHYFHLFSLGALAIGPDFETLLKTETDDSLGYGYNRFMPGVQAAWQLPSGWRSVLRARYEFSTSENPGVRPLHRVALRPYLYPPMLGPWSFWVRADILLDVYGAPAQYNVEWLAAVRVDPRRRLTLFVEPRFYLGEQSRTTNLWRLRSGLTWSLGDLVHHPEGG